MIIRLATAADLPVLQKLVGYASEELEQKYQTPRMDQCVMFAITHGINTKQAVVVAEQDLQIIGWCARVNLPGLPPDHAEGVGTWTYEPFRNEHVGRDMRKFADKHAQQLGLKFVTGVAAVDNEAGLKSCIKEGYRIVGYALRKDLVHGSQRTEKGHQTQANDTEALLVLNSG